RKTIETLVHQVEKVETAIEPRFQSHFVEAMGIPHSTAQYPHLRQVVALPEPKVPTPRGGARGARRRPAPTAGKEP
ncbi:MAG: ASKHA domain-containing protein, partial [Steroidobacteraceae bacterium]